MSLVATTRRVLSGVVLVSLVAASGCTICPNPYDYSGPVPNGSVTQNNFCARSGGIRPLGGAPLVWPQVVQAEEAAAEESGVPAPEEQAEGESVLLAIGEEATGGVVVTSGESEVEPTPEPRWRRLLR